MKKSLLVTGSFFVLGALFVSPLHAMNEQEENFDSRLNRSIQQTGLNYKPSEENSIEECRRKRELSLKVRGELGDKDISKQAIDYANEVLKSSEATGNDRRTAHFARLQKRHFQYVAKVEMLGDAATFEDHCNLILGYLNIEMVQTERSAFSEFLTYTFQALRKDWGQDPQTEFFISFLNSSKNTDHYIDFVKRAKSLPVDNTTSFIDILKINALMVNEENVENLQNEFYKKYSKEKYDSELELYFKVNAQLELYHQSCLPMINQIDNDYESEDEHGDREYLALDQKIKELVGNKINSYYPTGFF